MTDNKIVSKWRDASEQPVTEVGSSKCPSSVFISGIFNVLHPGHIRLFKFAAELADRVVIGLLTKDDSEDPMLPDRDRLQALKAVSLVHEVYLMEDLESLLRELQPNVVLKGSEFRRQLNVEGDIIKDWGGKLVFSSGESQFGNQKFLEKNGYKKEAYFPTAYKTYIRRHNIQKCVLKDALGQFSQKRVAVIGDTILDEYVDCDPVGLSREDPTIVVTPTEKNRYVGGAAIVAQHTKAFGADVDFYSVTGDDSKADWLAEKMISIGVNRFIYRDQSRPTTVKKRFRTQNKTLLRVNEYRSHAISEQTQQQLLSNFSDNIHKYDLVVFSDFSYGLLNQSVISDLQNVARKHGVAMAADSQTSSQRGDLSKFKDLRLVAPTEIEARLAVNINDNGIGLAKIIEEVGKQLLVDNVLITLGAEGVLVMDANDTQYPQLDSLPALNKSPMDVSGAGDVLLISTALFEQAGCDLWHASLAGMIASGIHVSQVGNTPISLPDFYQYLDVI